MDTHFIFRNSAHPKIQSRDLCYRFPDLTRYSEFIYRTAVEAVTTDIPQEQTAMAAYDRAAPAFAVAGLDERQAGLFIAIAKDNAGKIMYRFSPSLSPEQ